MKKITKVILVTAGLLIGTSSIPLNNIGIGKTEASTVSIPANYKLWKDEQKTSSLLPGQLVMTSPSKDKRLFINKNNGYKIMIPSSWEINRNQYTVFTKFYTKDLSIDVFDQDVSKLYMSTGQYIDKTVGNLKNYHLKKVTKVINGKKFIKYTYSRTKNLKIQGDLNKYAYYFYTSGHYVYTFHLKYSGDRYITSFENSLKTFQTINKVGISTNDVNRRISRLKFNKISYQGQNASFNIQTNQNVFGIYRPNAFNVDNKKDPHFNKVGAQLLYYGLTSPYDSYLDEMYKKNRIPIVSFMFYSPKKSSVNMNERILNGEFDQNLISWAKNVSKRGYPIFFRLGNEMNGKWVDCNATYSYNDTDFYKLAYRHIVDIFRANSATNAKFIWNPNGGNDPGFDWNEAQMYYPGDNYVDVIGMTAYNFGKTKYRTFTPFNVLFSDIYKDYLLSFGNKPMIIGETGSVEYGGNKSKFMNDMLTLTPKLYPNVRMIIYFDAGDQPYNFKINSSSKSDQAFLKGMKSPNIILGLK